MEKDPTLEEIYNCPLCGGNKFKKIIEKFSLQIKKCQVCSLVFTNPRLRKEIIKKRYSTDYFIQEYLGGLKIESLDEKPNLVDLYNHYGLYLEVIKNYFSPGKKLLEIGSAAGFFLHFAQKMGWQVTGVEHIPEAVKYARKTFNLLIYEGSFEEVEINEKFDLVVLLDVIEHFIDPVFCLKKAFKLLKSGGIIFISTPNYNSLSRRFLGKGWAVLSPADHLFYFTKTTLKLLLNKTGFMELKITDLADFEPKAIHTQWKNGRSKFYKEIIEGVGIKFIFSKIRERKFNEFLSIDEFSTGKIRQYRWPKKVMKLAKKIIYDLFKMITEGDRLLILASKP
ncbi:MAG: class I SAM-dependent methyltransferase [Candidatus Aminicenantes bacterium]|nr:class I SAM-dependent methyltransferase [Candidatus Aminicenantes bacterium]